VVTVAVVGLDGAGKTTITRRLVDRLPFETAYLYMGMNPASSNVSLPTTRLVHARKRAAVGAASAGSTSLHDVAERRRPRGVAWSTLRLANRIAEEVVRHGIARAQHLRGRLVITDRDFFVDYSIAAKEPLGRLDRIHLWFLGSVLPKPDLVVWLDASPAVLYARKPEVPLSYLERRRDGLAQLRPAFAHFEVVDAERSEDEVYDAVERLIVAACSTQRITPRLARGAR
jgi:thymidylate kinase